jgi:hypothetical protein
MIFIFPMYILWWLRCYYDEGQMKILIYVEDEWLFEYYLYDEDMDMKI